MRPGDIFAAGPSYATAVPPIDFETFSEAGYVWNEALQKYESLPGIANTNRGLSACGLRNYVQHPTFEVLSLAYDLLDGHGRQLWTPYLRRPPVPLIEWVQNNGAVESWYVNFERSAWNLYCVPKFGWPELGINQLHCAMAKARAHARPGKLADFGRVVGLTIQKDADGVRLLKKFTQPKNPSKKDPRRRIRLAEEPIDGPKLLRYNEIDIASELEASLRTPDLDNTERAIWEADQAINWRGVHVDRAGVEDCIAIVEQAHAKYNAELYQITYGAVTSASEVEKLRTWALTQGVYLQNIQDEYLEAVLKDPLPAVVRRALEIRQLLGSASIKKLFAIRAQASAADRLHDLYMYAAARTLRWNGAGPQPMNLPKGEFKSVDEVEKCLAVIASRCLELVEYYYGDALQAVANCLRGLFIAAPGHVLVCADYKAIEGVITAALAGEAWRLEVFRTHGKIYEASASRAFNVSLEEFERYKAEHGVHHPLRDKGKRLELACGFGGWIGATKSEHIRLDEIMNDDEIKSAILAWRAASPSIVEFWGGQSRGRFDSAYPELFGLEGAIVAAIQNPGNPGKAFACRDIVYQMHGDALYCRVPSGGVLTYHRPRLRPAEPRGRYIPNKWELGITYEGWNSNPQQGPIGWITMDLYAGKACENVVQRVGRDQQAYAMVNLENNGYAIVLHTHDELAAEIPEDGFGTLEEFVSIMGRLRPECANWPIKVGADYWRGRRYRKG